MPFHFVCPYCFKKTLVDDGLAGQSGPCAGCGKTVTIPAPAEQHAGGLKPVKGRYVKAPARMTKSRRFLTRMVQFGGLLVGIALLSSVSIYLFWPTFQTLKSRRDKFASMNNLQRVAMALNAYALRYGTYPPPVVVDDKGLPLYSWRVLILPDLGEEALYAKFDLSKAWDSQENINLVTKCPEVLQSPSAAAVQGSAESNYVLLTGMGTLFPPSGPLSPKAISDGASNTLLLVETDSGALQWSSPWDIEVSKLNTRIGLTGPNTIGGIHSSGAGAAFADGTSAWLPSDTSPTLLRSLISPSGGEPVITDDFK